MDFTNGNPLERNTVGIINVNGAWKFALDGVGRNFFGNTSALSVIDFIGNTNTNTLFGCSQYYLLDMVKTIQKRAKRSKIWKMPYTKLIVLVKQSKTFTEILSVFHLSNKGGNSSTLKRRLVEENIDFSHIRLGKDSNKGKKFGFFGMTKSECLKHVFVRHSPYKRNTARRYIQKYNLIPYKCLCGLVGEWCGKTLSLQLEHKNGIGNDHRLNNLEWMCPNCHSQTKTFAGRNK